MGGWSQPLWFPPRCGACDQVGLVVCDACRAKLVRVGETPPPPGCERSWAAMGYGDTARRLIHAFKYRHRTAMADWFAQVLLDTITRSTTSGIAEIGRDGAVPVIVWVPSSLKNRSVRGYQPSQEVAGALADRTGLAVDKGLVRIDGGSQTGLSRRVRLRGPKIVARRSFADQSVLLLDDVITTGATMSAAAWALRSAGAETVITAAIARS